MLVTVARAADEAVVEGTDAAASLFPPFETSTFASQLFWLALTFGFFYWFLKKHALPRLSETIDLRRSRIESDTVSARRLREEADAAEAAYVQDLATARANAQAIAAEARDRANAETSAKRNAAEADLNRRLEESEGRIRAIKAEALGHVNEIAEDVTGAILTRVTGRDYPADRVRDAVAHAARDMRGA